ncbi:MAG: hypothetical protein K8T89_19215, partial [Planctomycetes bacterium]|nr:hypothetical protein [Planctomycetota bacterium]
LETAAKAKDDAFSFIDQLVAEAPSLAMTRGAMRSAFSAGFNEKTAEAANKILERFKSDYDPVFFMVLGNSYLNWAAPTVEVPTWNKERARKALFAFERVQKEDPDNLSVANNIAWIYLKALETPDAADRAAEPLRKAESENRLSDIHVGTLGIVQLAKGRYDSARGYLTRSVASAPSATRYVHLALAHYYLKNSDEARRNLRLANNLPCSPADTLELKKAQALLERK